MQVHFMNMKSKIRIQATKSVHIMSEQILCESGKLDSAESGHTVSATLENLIPKGQCMKMNSLLDSKHKIVDWHVKNGSRIVKKVEPDVAHCQINDYETIDEKMETDIQVVKPEVNYFEQLMKKLSLKNIFYLFIFYFLFLNKSCSRHISRK